MKIWKTIGIKIVAFLLVFVVLFLGVQQILRFKWGAHESMSEKMESCRTIEPGLDVLYLGSSPLFAGISPIILWKEQGITGINLGMSEQNVLCMYYLLLEALDYQSPKLVVLDFYDFTTTRNVEANSRYESAYLKTMEVISWPHKIDMIREIMATNENQNPLNYAFPLLRYHTRWTELEKKDFAYQSSYREYQKGAYQNKKVVSITPNQKYYPQDGLDENGEVEASDFAIYYYRKIVERCQERNIQVVALTLPNAYIPSASKYERIQEFCDTYAVPYLNYNTDEGRVLVDIQFDEDLYDEGHLNIHGNIKMSRELAKQFHEQFGLEDHREDMAYASWNTDWNAFYKDFEEILQQHGY